MCVKLCWPFTKKTSYRDVATTTNILAMHTTAKLPGTSSKIIAPLIYPLSSTFYAGSCIFSFNKCCCCVFLQIFADLLQPEVTRTLATLGTWSLWQVHCNELGFVVL